MKGHAGSIIDGRGSTSREDLAGQGAGSILLEEDEVRSSQRIRIQEWPNTSKSETRSHMGHDRRLYSCQAYKLPLV